MSDLPGPSIENSGSVEITAPKKDEKGPPMLIKTITLILLVILFLTLIGCAQVDMGQPPLEVSPHGESPFRMGQIIEAESGSTLDFDAFIGQLSRKDIIFIGEVHNHPTHHLIQIQIIQALMARSDRVILAMEFFPVTKQAALDHYLADQMTEDAFLKDVDWQHSWGYDYSLYRPLMLLAKQNRIAVIAINAPPEVVKKVARQGLANLEPEERALLAQDIDLNQEAHRIYLQSIFEQHTHNDLKQFDYFYQAQCSWEDTMAQNIAVNAKKRDGIFVVLAGNGHLIRKFGIPNRTFKRHPVPMATVLPFPLSGQVSIDPGIGDYLWFTGPYHHGSILAQHPDRKDKPKKEE